MTTWSFAVDFEGHIFGQMFQPSFYMENLCENFVFGIQPTF